MSRIYTEIRIAHESPEAKETFEKELDEAINALGYRNRTEWLNTMFLQTIEKAQKRKFRIVLTDGDEVVDSRMVYFEEYEELQKTAKEATDGNWFWTIKNEK